MTICNGSTSYRGTLGAGMFCAGTMAGGRDSCQVFIIFFIIIIIIIIIVIIII